MAKIEPHHLFIIPYLSIICALCSSLPAFPLLLSLALSSNLTLMLTHFVTPRWLPLPSSLPLPLSPHRSEDTSARRRISLQSPPPPSSNPPSLSSLFHSISPCPTLFIFLPALSFATHTHTHTHSVVNKAGRWGNKGPPRRRGTLRTTASVSLVNLVSW